MAQVVEIVCATLRFQVSSGCAATPADHAAMMHRTPRAVRLVMLLLGDPGLVPELRRHERSGPVLCIQDSRLVKLKCQCVVAAGRILD